MKKVVYSIIGGGWRAEFYLRIASFMPDRFEVKCIYVRNEERAKYIRDKYNVNVVGSLEKLKATPCDFIVNCINAGDISDLTLRLAEEGFYVLSETPACRNKAQADSFLENFKENYKVQVAEQYHLKPMYQAIKKVIEMGIIGEVNYIDISVGHDYHAMSLIRFFMGEEKPVKVCEYTNMNPTLHTHGRGGEIENKEVKGSKHVVKIFDFNGKTAVYDFTDEQYFSPVRRDRLLIRGSLGEIDNDIVRYFNENNEYCEGKLLQHRSGNLEGLFNGNITFENAVLYKALFGDVRITDEETSIATLLLKMKEYVETGKEFYCFKDAIKDVVYFI